MEIPLKGADRLAERIDDQGYQHEDRQVREARYHHHQKAFILSLSSLFLPVFNR